MNYPLYLWPEFTLGPKPIIVSSDAELVNVLPRLLALSPTENVLVTRSAAEPLPDSQVFAEKLDDA